MSGSGRVVLVTGGSGLVGWGVRSTLEGAKEVPAGDVPQCSGGVLATDDGTTWHFASSKDANLLDMAETKALFDRVKPTHVLHLAAQVGGLFKNMNQKVAMCRENMLINDNVLFCANQAAVERCLSCLSTCVLPDHISVEGRELTEEMVHDGPPHPSNAGYAHAKRMIDVLGRCYNGQEGVSRFTTFIPTNVYGHHDNFSIEDGHVLPGLINKCYLAKRAGDDFVVWGTGKPLRQFIYNEDLGKLMKWALFNYTDDKPLLLSVSPAAEVSIETAARMVARAFGYEERLTLDTSKSDGQFKKTASNAKLMGLLPDFEFEDLETGIQATVKWFQENYDVARK